MLFSRLSFTLTLFLAIVGALLPSKCAANEALIRAKVSDLSLRHFLLHSRSGETRWVMVHASLLEVENPKVALAMFLEWSGFRTAAVGQAGVLIEATAPQLIRILPDITAIEPLDERAMDSGELELSEGYRNDSANYRRKLVLEHPMGGFKTLDELTMGPELSELSLFVSLRQPLATHGTFLRKIFPTHLHELGFQLIGVREVTIHDEIYLVFIVQMMVLNGHADARELISLGQGAHPAFDFVRPARERDCRSYFPKDLRSLRLVTWVME